MRRWRTDHPDVRERERLYSAEWNKANLERSIAYRKERASELRASRQRYYRENTERHKAATARWFREHPERSMEYSLVRKRRVKAIRFTAAQLADRMSMFGNRCWMCNGPKEAVDHVKPVSRGGLHTLSNLRPACKSCNSRKHARWSGVQHLDEFKQGQ